MIARIATGDLVDDDGKDENAAAMGRKGAAARARKLTPKRRSEIARKAAEARWGKKP